MTNAESATMNTQEGSAVEARHVSAWTTKQKIVRALWYLVQGTLFRWSPRVAYGWRGMLLRMFGAKVDASARIRPTVSIEVPWNLTIGAQSSVGDHAILYCLGTITIGARVSISQYAHLCAGTHEYTRQDMPLLRPPIMVEDDVWIAADVFVGPNVTIGKGTVVGARSTVLKSLPAWKVCLGFPAIAVKDRIING